MTQHLCLKCTEEATCQIAHYVWGCASYHRESCAPVSSPRVRYTRGLKLNYDLPAMLITISPRKERKHRVVERVS
jgi:hypothetical protein